MKQPLVHHLAVAVYRTPPGSAEDALIPQLTKQILLGNDPVVTAVSFRRPVPYVHPSTPSPLHLPPAHKLTGAGTSPNTPPSYGRPPTPPASKQSTSSGPSYLPQSSPSPPRSTSTAHIIPSLSFGIIRPACS